MNLGIQDFGAFLLSAVLLNLTPGQDTLYILGRTITQGRRNGIAAALGVSAGTGIHSAAAALGISALIAASDTAFTLLKTAGAAYLVYLGIRLLWTRQPLPAAHSTPRGTSAAAAFREGVVTNVLNPKVALFFLAFLPQFVDPASPHRIVALLLLGLTFVSTSTCWCLILALGTARVRHAISTIRRTDLLLKRAVGLLFIGLGVRLVLTDH